MNARDDLVGGADDRLDLVFRQLPELEVGLCRRLFQNAKGADHRAPPDEPAAPDREIFQRALRLGAP